MHNMKRFYTESSRVSFLIFLEKGCFIDLDFSESRLIQERETNDQLIKELLQGKIPKLGWSLNQNGLVSENFKAKAKEKENKARSGL